MNYRFNRHLQRNRTAAASKASAMESLGRLGSTDQECRRREGSRWIGPSGSQRGTDLDLNARQLADHPAKVNVAAVDASKSPE